MKKNKHIIAFMTLLVVTTFCSMVAPREAEAQPFQRIRERIAASGNVSEPIMISGNVRRPFLFFRDSINKPWKPFKLFLMMIGLAAALGLLAPAAVRAATDKCRSRFFGSLAAAFIFTICLLTLARFAFQSEALVPLALLSIGVVQFAYVLGIGLGINVICRILMVRLTDNKKLTALQKRLWSVGLVFAVSSSLALISMVGNLGRLPRLGNRLVILVAIIGLGGLLASLYSRYRNESANESITGS